MKKQKKKSSEQNISDNDRDAIAKAASALNAFEGEEMDFINEDETKIEAMASTEVESEEGRDGDTGEVSEDMGIWNEVEEAVESAALDDASEEVDDLGEEEDFSEDFSEEAELEAQVDADAAPVEGTELAGFESAEIEDVEFVSDDQLMSVIESVLFANDRPVSVAFFRQMFRGTNIKTKDIKEALERLASDYAAANRGVTLEEVSSGFQLRTKLDNVRFLRQSVKARPFKLSGPALEVLSIVAYKQPVTKAQIDEIRGVESGHLLRALMEKNIVSFGERSDLPGKPMFYETTRKFLEIFGLRNVRELPSLHEIDQLIPEGIGAAEDKKETLGDLTEQLSQQTEASYSQGEEELLKITDELSQITTSSEFFEQEKQRMRDKKDQERAQDIRERIAIGETVDAKDVRWLERYDEAQILKAKGEAEVDFVMDESSVEVTESLEIIDEPMESSEPETPAEIV